MSTFSYLEIWTVILKTNLTKITEKNLMNWCKFGVNYCCNALLTLSFDNMSSVGVGYWVFEYNGNGLQVTYLNALAPSLHELTMDPNWI